MENSKALEEKVIGYRRKIHRTPELKYEEHNTAELVIKVLENLGITVKRNVGKIKDIKNEFKAMGEEPSEDIAPTGIVGELHGTKGAGKTVALRADMDALPLSESEDPNHIPNKEGFRSKRPGIMHACGHDAHVAMLLGAAEVLSQMKDEFKGTIKLIFQPAEEGGNGAKVMRKAGVLEDVDAIFGIHVWAELESGKVKIN
ncbi:MAG: amidohydrolase, partial [Candidatus Thorarchaeota archaeon]|nr:amidohydrolase [Candidatus Thorarchaeota archaeon]NIW14335.1 amidohydrolase [Candidatus Thorarchaeota archaeon]